MSTLAKILVSVVALAHIYFLVLEMFLWTKPRTRAAFGMSESQAEATRVLAANQGLYNGFLAAGLIWSVIAPPHLAVPVAIFFTVCVIVAGLYGAATANKRILFVQALPAALALAAVLFS
jgi:putative membrane protein